MCISCTQDLRDIAALRGAIAEIAARHRDADGLINNAGHDERHVYQSERIVPHVKR